MDPGSMFISFTILRYKHSAKLINQSINKSMSCLNPVFMFYCVTGKIIEIIYIYLYLPLSLSIITYDY
jgi:hypothetical protein